MTIPSTSSAALLADGGPSGADARQEYAVAVAVKVQDQVQQEGAAIVQLIDAQPTPPEPSATVGNHLNVLR